MLRIDDLTIRIAGRVLIEGASYSLVEGHKAGLVGRNGTGKSTLFRVIAGDLAPDGGAVDLRPAWRVGRVAQEAPDGEQSLLDTVLGADTELAALSAEAETATDPHRIAAIHERLTDIDAHTAPSRAATILSGLGFDDTAQAQPCRSFSGGWRMRVALAGALFARPDFLMLDEPTNHLDLESTLWLESYLASWRGTLLMISHERSLLNAVCDEIVHLEGNTLVRYSGNYDRFERTREERLAVEGRLRERQETERKRIQAFVDRFRAKATKARQAQSRIKQLARMKPITAVMEEPSVAFDLPSPEELPPPLLVLDEASAGYAPDKPVLRGLDLRIDSDDRIALVGANGNGKSTLIRVLGGRLAPLEGSLRPARKLRIGYFAQHQTEELSAGRTAFDHMAERMPRAVPAVVRAHLGRFGFSQSRADTRAANLSGGEKARLLFALMTCDKPHILLLDEPTNHLDVDAREALVQALNVYEGAVILVSHDPHLIDLVCDRLWLVADGTCQPFDGDMSDYRKSLTDRSRRGANGGSQPAAAPAGDRRERRQKRASARAGIEPLRRTARDAESRLHKLTEQRDKLRRKLADPGLYAGSPDDITAIQLELAETEQALEVAEQAWLTAHEALESAREDIAG